MRASAPQLALLNNAQGTFDAARCEMARLREEPWYEWWKCSSGAAYIASAGVTAVKAIKIRIGELVAYDVSHNISGAIASLKKLLSSGVMCPGVTVQQGRAQPFARAADPTVLFATVASPWPDNHGAALAPGVAEDHFADPAAVQALLRNAINLSFFSATLDGLSDHLLTLMHGTHISAAVAAGRGQQPQAHSRLSQAACGVTEADLLAIGAAGADSLTPYGSTVPVGPHCTTFSPFKPVVHGRARFIKLTIVDKFGQVAPLYPCVSPALSRGWLPGTSPPVADTVVAVDPPGACQFFQLPLRINQEARLNVWPLVTAAPADGGSAAVSAGGNSSRISALTAKLAADTAFTTAFFAMLAAALSSTTSTPADYADLAFPTVLGRPFALVAFGVGLEVAAPPRKNQPLLCPDRSSANDPNLTDYRFPYKVGDGDAAFDGLVTYFTDSGAGTGTVRKMYTELLVLDTKIPTDAIIQPAPGAIFQGTTTTTTYPTLTLFFLPADATPAEQHVAHRGPAQAL
ncbi:hypothetical protein N657DRAFT_683178 [Parathielavia appendiculata]|uniref:Uncharacterized protein n=1 Tax=Parathielavia appendiculata TaxID=2587402 RepID=A0AAN6TW86_9PEZI|nr:hypothetical protein N657DRAFT_683178 [Parathielavia appendiculata]